MNAGAALAVILAIIGAVLLLRLAERKGPRDHLLVTGAATLAAGVAYRFFDVLQHMDAIRWSAPVGATALLLFLVADCRSQQLRNRRQGVDRRARPRLGTDPDEDFPRPD